MKRALIVLALLAVPSAVAANDWEEYYVPLDQTTWLTRSTSGIQSIFSIGDVEQDMERMWRLGYAAIGYTVFETGNNLTDDAFKLGRKLGARYVILDTQLTDSWTSYSSISTPTTSTSYSSGTVRSGSASGTYSGTTTRYGSETTLVPYRVNRFTKFALYFMEVPKYGAGIKFRLLNSRELAAVETRRAVAVRWVRDHSPAYNADIFPGDIIVTLNGEPYEERKWQAAIRQDQPLEISLFRNGKYKNISLTIPPDWRPR